MDTVVDPTLSDTNGAVVNLINAIVGAGIVAIPYSVMQCGFFNGIFLVLFLAYAIYESMVILIDCGIKTKSKSLEELCLRMFGSKGYYTASAFMFMYSYGSMIAILVVIGDIVPFSMSLLFGIDIASMSRNLIIVLVATCCTLPLSLLRDLASLSVASTFSLLALFILVVFVVIFGREMSYDQGTSADVDELTLFGDQMMSGIGTLSFHYVCQHSVLLIFNSLRNPTLHNWKRVASMSMLTVLSLTIIIGIGGVLCFAHSTKSNVLNNFPQNHVMITIARLCMALNVIFTYPMECFIVRHSLFAIAFRLKKSDTLSVQFEKDDHVHINSNRDKDFTSPSQNGADDNGLAAFSFNHHVKVTLLIWISTVILAISFQDVSVVLEFSGVLTGSVLGYLLPSLIYFKVHSVSISDILRSLYLMNGEGSAMSSASRKGLTKDYALSILFAVFGIFILVVGMGQQLFQLLGSISSPDYAERHF